MSYQVTARKWRPLDFAQLVGQTHISQTLLNAIKNGRVPHALLFTGPRGTGKTSSARIFAKSLRCPQAVDFQPCNQCQDCLDIGQGRSIDVIEIDGASNNGVEAIRELREGVSFMPSSGKYKVYIIDEVHMLSASAFNALLKTLEEPPAHVVFVLATTEVQKIPETILSRCQRFDFRKISTRLIADHLAKICKAESIQFDEESLWMIARQAGGSMRDSQSLLDQVVSFSTGSLQHQNVLEILGLTDRNLLLEALQAFAVRDQSKLLPVLKKINSSGLEPDRFIEELLQVLRHLLLIKVQTGDVTEMVDLADSEVRFLKDLANSFSQEDIHALFDMALKGASDLLKSSEPLLVLEMVLLRMVNSPNIASIQELLQGGGKLTAAAAAPTVTATRPLPASTMANSTPVTVSSAPKAEVVASAKSMAGKPWSEQWFEFVRHVKSLDPMFAAKIENLVFLGESNKAFELGIPSKLSFLRSQLLEPATKQTLQGFIEQHFGAGFSFSIKASADQAQGKSAQALEQEKAQQSQDELRQRLSEHPKVKAASLAFKSQIKEIKPIDSTGKTKH